MSYNRVILVGRITRDVELKALPSGQSVASFGMAMNEKYKDRDGNQKESVCFVDCEMFGPRAEAFAKYLGKGDQVLVEGKLKLDTWEKDGQKRSKLKVSVFSFEFVGGKDKAAGNVEPKPQGKSYGHDSDIPF